MNAITGNTVALVVGIVGSLWGAFGVTAAVQNALNDVWGVPLRRRANFIFSRLRGLLLFLALIVAGLQGLLATTGICVGCEVYNLGRRLGSSRTAA